MTPWLARAKLLAWALLLVSMACQGGGTPPQDDDTTPGQASSPAPSPTLPALEVIARGVDMPVALAPSPDGRLFFAEQGGTIRVISPEGRLLDEPVTTLPVARPPGYSEHGLLGLALHPNFPQEPYIYAFYTFPGPNGRPLGQRVVRLRLEGNKAVSMVVVQDNLPAGPRCCHNGGRLLFLPDGTLLITLGDAESPQMAQDPYTPHGAILRINPDGSLPPNNPFPGSPVYAYGLRNVFGIAQDRATGELWATDNGPSGHDELNRIVPGGNYGWPQVSGLAGMPSLIDPVFDSGTHSLAPTGIALYRGEALPFYGDLFFCTWNARRLWRVPAQQLEELRKGGRKVIQPEETSFPCALDIKEGPDGYLYFSDAQNIYRLRP